MEDRPITTTTALEYGYGLHLHQGKRLETRHYRYMRAALARVADRVGHGRGSGRPWLWRLRDGGKE
jgi:hypothetical protein